jgi:hypothetical protein
MMNAPSNLSKSHSAFAAKSTLADMDQQLGALMSDDPLWTDGPGLAADPLAGPNFSLPSYNSQKLDAAAWDASTLSLDDVAVRPLSHQTVHHHLAVL